VRFELGRHPVEGPCQLADFVAGIDGVAACAVDITSRESIRRLLHDTVSRLGGLDIIVNTAAVFPSADLPGRTKDKLGQSTRTLNVTATYLLADETAVVFDAQKTTPPSSSRVRQMPPYPGRAARPQTRGLTTPVKFTAETRPAAAEGQCRLSSNSFRKG
jgi:NAD(P)-dependent dehydrogenase (short-subunit alcohol dehydrogenase family)